MEKSPRRCSVTVRLRGEHRHGEAAVIEDDEAVAEYVREYIDRHGIDSVNRLALAIESEGLPTKEALTDGLTKTVVIRITLNCD